MPKAAKTQEPEHTCGECEAQQCVECEASWPKTEMRKVSCFYLCPECAKTPCCIDCAEWDTLRIFETKVAGDFRPCPKRTEGGKLMVNNIKNIVEASDKACQAFKPRKDTPCP